MRSQVFVRTVSNVTAHTTEVYLSVMTGSGCSNLTCLTFSSVYSHGSEGLSFLAQEEASYYVAISGPTWGSEAGSFSLIAGVGPRMRLLRFYIFCCCCAKFLAILL